MKRLKGNLYAPNETVQNYNEGSFEQLPAGVYCCKICQVKDEPDREYLYVEYDIAQGDFAGYFERLSDRAGFWGGRIYLSYKDKAESMFKLALKAINVDNMPYSFNPYDDGKNADEKTLIGKLFWVVLHEEEYTKNDGSTGTRMTASANAIIKGDFAKSDKFNKKLLEKTTARRQASAPASSETPDFMDSVDNPFA